MTLKKNLLRVKYTDFPSEPLQIKLSSVEKGLYMLFIYNPYGSFSLYVTCKSAGGVGLGITTRL